MSRDPHLEAAAHRTVEELSQLAQDLIADGQLYATIQDHAARLREIAEGLARALDAQPVASSPARPAPVRRSRPPIDHDRP